MRRASAIAAVTFDAHGTLLSLDDPVGRMGRELARLGHPRPRTVVAEAFAAEVAWYRAHLDRAGDAAGLAAVRAGAEAVVARRLPGVAADAAATALRAALRYRLFDDVLPALDALAARGVALGVVSDWDASLPEVLADLGIGGRFAVVAASAVVGARKPDPALFLHAAAVLGVPPGSVVHVGDDPARDLAGARAAGMRAVLVDRAGVHGGAWAPTVSDLGGLAAAIAPV